MADRPSIPQFCCATCANWRDSGSDFKHVGFCGLTLGHLALSGVKTLDLQVCSKWEKSDQAEKVMYGSKG